VCRPKHVEQLRNIEIINSTTRLHLVGYFYEICWRSITVFVEFRVYLSVCTLLDGRKDRNINKEPQRNEEGQKEER
jgi:hypothetical protein